MKRDPVEQTEEYKKAMEEVQLILDKEFPSDRLHFGICHAIWNRKTVLLKERGVEWKSPAIMNPHIMFD